jgi:hypothetical protein
VQNKDVWFQFVPTTPVCAIQFGQAYSVSHDLAAMVFNGESCSFFYDYRLCNDDDGPDNYPKLVAYDLIPGATYWLRVWQYNAAIDSGSAKICIVCEPIAGNTAKTGINTQFPSAALDINGTMKIRGGSPGANKVLTSDALGNASWQPIPVPPLNNVAFGVYAYSAPGQSIPSSVFTKILFNEIEEAGATNVSSGVFTAPVTGVYHFDASAAFPLSNSTSAAIRIVVKNGATVIRNYETRENNLPTSSETTLAVAATIQLTAGYTVEVQLYHNAGGAVQLNSTGTLGIDRKTRFQGFKVF